MPQTRLERLVALLGLVVIGALLVVIVRDWSNQDAQSVVPPASPPRTTTSAAPVVTPATTSTAKRPAKKKRRKILSITAARGDAWFEVRSVSSTGRVLYTGILPVGESRSFRASPLWVRFGSAANVDARVGTRRVSLPAGTFDAVFRDGTLKRVGG